MDYNSLKKHKELDFILKGDSNFEYYAFTIRRWQINMSIHIH